MPALGYDATRVTSGAILDHLDGLRAVLAIAVVLYHTGQYTGLDGELDAVPVLPEVLALGEFAVPVFIVLSGFTLMISVARSDQLEVRGGWGGHLRRRAKRLLPPYFAALLVSIFLIAALPPLNTTLGTQWDRKIPMSVEAVISHLLLIHNLSPDLIGLLNGSLWSIAVEWQITLAMPLILMLWRRTNTVAVVAAMTALGVASSTSGVLAWSAPFFPLLFTLGMLAAYWTQGDVGAIERRRGRLVGIVLHHHRVGTIVSTILLVGVLAASSVRPVPMGTMMVGVVASMLLAFDQERARHDDRAPVMTRILSLDPLRRCGNASYSIYLLHAPLLALGNLLLLPIEMPTIVRFVVLMLTVVPVTLLACGAFYLAVERRFLNSHQRTVTPTGRGRRRRGTPIAVGPVDRCPTAPDRSSAPYGATG
ncbi:acyltransferase family protein [Curtobacterium luteum]|uniref:acyltransferase family protein n=1 Tax=Curtobacterium luteum TaxID=33881 RepID=UPI00382B7886